MVVELQSTAMGQQEHAPVTEHAVPKQIQHAPCATYPTPPPSPDSYTGDNFADYDPDTDEMGVVFKTK